MRANFISLILVHHFITFISQEARHCIQPEAIGGQYADRYENTNISTGNFYSGCASASVTHTVSQANQDLLILSILVQDHLRKTNGRSTDLTELIKKDSLNIISNSFKTVELKSKGGHISVYCNFSESRDSKAIKLTEKEQESTKYISWTEKELKSAHDAEIQLDYGERFYRLIKIIVNRRKS